MARQGQLFVVSAPSGTGKTTVVERLVMRVPDLRMSCSYTSRAPRVGEADDVDYHFVSRENFEQMRERDAFLEFASVFENYYGTSKDETESWLARGQDLVLVIDVQGARQVRALRRAVSVFVMPPSPEVLEARLRGRSRDDDDAIKRRLAIARCEVESYEHYDYVVVNDNLDHCVRTLEAIVLAERVRLDVTRGVARAIADRFVAQDAAPESAAAGRSVGHGRQGG
jgi:guanylate kinase